MCSSDLGSGGWVTGNDLADGDGTGILVRSWGDSCGAVAARMGKAAVCAARTGMGHAVISVCWNAVAGTVTSPCPWSLFRVRRNVATGYASYGISTDQAGDRFWHNDLRRNPGIACADASGDPVLNRWVGNRGARSLPAGLCGPR